MLIRILSSTVGVSSKLKFCDCNYTMNAFPLEPTFRLFPWVCYFLKLSALKHIFYFVLILNVCKKRNPSNKIQNEIGAFQMSEKMLKVFLKELLSFILIGIKQNTMKHWPKICKGIPDQTGGISHSHKWPMARYLSSLRSNKHGSFHLCLSHYLSHCCSITCSAVTRM